MNKQNKKLTKHNFKVGGLFRALLSGRKPNHYLITRIDDDEIYGIFLGGKEGEIFLGEVQLIQQSIENRWWIYYQVKR